MASIAGLIGPGKSTACAALEKQLGLTVIGEPADENPILPYFYADMQKYGLLMQLWILKHRFLAYCCGVTRKGERVICDRFIGEDWAFFICNVWAGNIREDAVPRYEALYEAIMQDVPMIREVFFLDATPEVCLQRIKQRSRGGETAITVEYLRTLARGYDEVRARLEAKGVTWHILDWSTFGNFGELKERVEAVLPFSQEELDRMPSSDELAARVLLIDEWMREEARRVEARAELTQSIWPAAAQAGLDD